MIKNWRCRAFRTLLILPAAAMATVAMAQMATTTVDLTNPVFSQHASLPLNEMPGSPILQSLQPLVDAELRKGKPGKVYTALLDQDTGIGPYPSFSSLFQDLTCRADAILIGRIQNSLTHLTASGAAIYTDYDFAIDTLLKDNPRSTLGQTKHVAITRPGGVLPVPGGFVEYNNEMVPRLRQGRSYLLFVSIIPGSGAYQPASDAQRRAVFSTLEFQSSEARWAIYRSAYTNRNLPELADGSIRSIIGAAASNCK